MPVMDIAAAWYTSGIFWAGAGVVVAVVAVAATVWVTLAVGFPRRRLYYGLLAAPDGMRSDLELRHRGTLLADPHILTVELLSRGRKDITSDDFHDQQPLRLDVGARIVEVLKTASEPETVITPKVATDGTALEIGPSLISRRHKITTTVLTDGGTPFVTCQSPLIQVQVHLRADELSSITSVAAALTALAAAVVAAAALATPVAVAPTPAGRTATLAVAVAAAAAAALAFMAVLMDAKRKKTRTRKTGR